MGCLSWQQMARAIVPGETLTATPVMAVAWQALSNTMLSYTACRDTISISLSISGMRIHGDGTRVS